MGKYNPNKVYGEITLEAVIEDFHRVESITKKGRVTKDDYEEHGLYSQNVIHRWFGQWDEANRAAGYYTWRQKFESSFYLRVSKRMRYAVLERDNFRCVACGKSPKTDESVILHIDHILPKSKGGLSVITNLQTLCRDCNLGKSNIGFN